MFNLESLIPRLCQLAQEIGKDEKMNKMRAAGLQALSSMVVFHIPMFDNMYGAFFFLLLFGG